VDLAPKPGRSTVLYFERPSGWPEGEASDWADKEVFVHPGTGEILGMRRWGDLSEGWVNLMPFVYRLHYSLALGTAGGLVLGMMALLWTIDCFVGAFLTFPKGVPDREKSTAARRLGEWLRRWAPAWLASLGGGLFKMVFSLHRALGLWFWAVLFVFAWSSVAFNLSEVYRPVMRGIFAHQPGDGEIAELASPQPEPGIAWAEAKRIGRSLMAAEAQARGFALLEDRSLSYDARRGVYQFSSRTSRDLGPEAGGAAVWFDANSGALRATYFPAGEASGDTITTWLLNLHMGKVWGLPYRLLVCFTGAAVALLSITGVWIWWRKRRARRRADRSTIMDSSKPQTPALPA